MRMMKISKSMIRKMILMMEVLVMKKRVKISDLVNYLDNFFIKIYYE